MILDIDVQGFNQIKETLKDTISIFIIPPSMEELKKRLITRGLDSDDVIKKRLANAKTELKSAELFDYVVLNKDFDKALEEISAIIFGKHYENNQVNINGLAWFALGPYTAIAVIVGALCSFPAPDGAAKIIKFPLFDILDLFTHFFY